MSDCCHVGTTRASGARLSTRLSTLRHSDPIAPTGRLVLAQVILKGLMAGISSIGYIAILLFLVFYLFAVMGMLIFKESDPAHFSGLGHAMVSLFRAATMEDWSDLMYVAMLGCGEYGYPALDETGWVPGVGVRNGTVTAACEAAPLGPKMPNATEFCGGPLGTVDTMNNRACFANWEDYLVTASNKSWIIWLGSTDSTPISPFYYIFFVLVAGIVMLSLFIGAVTLGMQDSMNEMTAAKTKARLERLKKAAKKSKEQFSQDGKAARMLLELWTATPGSPPPTLEDEPQEQLPPKDMAEALERGGLEPLKFRWRRTVAFPCKAIADSSAFNNFVTIIIIIAAILVGFDFTEGQQVDLRKGLDCGGACPNTVTLISDKAINIIFSIEVLVKLLAADLRPWTYFHSGWNNFDFTIVALAWIEVGPFVVVLRLLRLLRVLKLVRALPQLQVIVSALVKGLSSIGYIAILLFLIYYVFAILGMVLFQANDPWHFGTLHITMFTLFRCSTLEDWTDVMYINMYGCDVYGYRNNYMLHSECKRPGVPFGSLVPSVIYFLIFIVLTNLVTLSLFIGVVTTSMQEATDAQNEERKKKLELDKLKAQYGISQERVDMFQTIFNVFDWSGDKAIDRVEFAFAIRCINAEATENQISDWMMLGDPECTGEIDFIAFTAVLMKLDKERLEGGKAQKAKLVSAEERRVKAKGLKLAAADASKKMLSALVKELNAQPSYSLLRASSMHQLASKRRSEGRRANLAEEEEEMRGGAQAALSAAAQTAASEAASEAACVASPMPTRTLSKSALTTPPPNTQSPTPPNSAYTTPALTPHGSPLKGWTPVGGGIATDDGSGGAATGRPQSPMPPIAERADGKDGAAMRTIAPRRSPSPPAGSGTPPRSESPLPARDAAAASEDSVGGKRVNKVLAAFANAEGGSTGFASLFKKAGEKAISIQRMMSAPLTALPLGEQVIPPEMGAVLEYASDGGIGGKNLEGVLKRLNWLKRLLAVRIRQLKLQGDELGQSSEADVSAAVAQALTFCEDLRGQLDDLEAVLYRELKPKLIGTDDNGSGQLVLGGHVVAQVVRELRVSKKSDKPALTVLKAAEIGSPATRAAATCAATAAIPTLSVLKAAEIGSPATRAADTSSTIAATADVTILRSADEWQLKA